MNKYLLANPFIFLPFNAGMFLLRVLHITQICPPVTDPRICLGQQVSSVDLLCSIVRTKTPLVCVSRDRFPHHSSFANV